MDLQTFTIPNRLASYAELFGTGANNTAALKAREEHNTKLVRWAIQKQDVKPVFGACRLRIKWVEPTSSRKPAHVAAAAVFIERALCETGIVKDPNRILDIYSSFAVNARDPRVEVTIEGAHQCRA